MSSSDSDFEITEEQQESETNEVGKNIEEMKVLLPESIVLRLTKQHIEAKYNYAKEVKTAFNISASAFVLYLTSNAVESAKSKNRKFIWPDDVFKGLECTGFEYFIESLRDAQKEYREVQKQLKNRKSLRKVSIESHEQNVIDLVTDINSLIENGNDEVDEY